MTDSGGELEDKDHSIVLLGELAATSCSRPSFETQRHRGHRVQFKPALCDLCVKKEEVKKR
jgi:hypothetical protein